MRQDSGFLLIDKARGLSSFDVIRSLRQLTGIRKIGHTGTLDPQATGLLICAIGSSTRLCKYLEAEDKSYSACLHLGTRTDTGDSEGRVIATDSNIPTNVDADALTHSVLAITELPTPQYSAVKISGKPAYAYARAGASISLDARPARISSFAIVSYDPPNMRYICRVSKGTYIRSLSEKIAALLGTVGYTSELCRTSIGSLQLTDALALDGLNSQNWRASLFPDRKVFAAFEGFVPGEPDLTALRNGQAVEQAGPDNPQLMLYDADDSVIGVAARSKGKLLPLVNLF